VRKVLVGVGGVGPAVGIATSPESGPDRQAPVRNKPITMAIATTATIVIIKLFWFMHFTCWMRCIPSQV
jgi:hypothetical protein